MTSQVNMPFLIHLATYQNISFYFDAEKTLLSVGVYNIIAKTPFSNSSKCLISLNN